jgi:hypothetical protein
MSGPRYSSVYVLQGLLHLTSLTRLTGRCEMGKTLLDVVAELTSLRALQLPPLKDWPEPSPLSTLRQGTFKRKQP